MQTETRFRTICHLLVFALFLYLHIPKPGTRAFGSLKNFNRKKGIFVAYAFNTMSLIMIKTGTSSPRAKENSQESVDVKDRFISTVFLQCKCVKPTIDMTSVFGRREFYVSNSLHKQRKLRSLRDLDWKTRICEMTPM